MWVLTNEIIVVEYSSLDLNMSCAFRRKYKGSCLSVVQLSAMDTALNTTCQ